MLKKNLTTSRVGYSVLMVGLFYVASFSALAKTQIAMLGTGTPVHNPQRSGPSTAIIVDNKSYIFDFGPGLVRRAASLSPRFGGDIEALSAPNLRIAFLSHLHSDHTAGFSDLLMTGWSSGNRKVRMQVFGPDGIQTLVKGVHDAYMDDIKYRLYHRGKSSDEGWRVDTTVVKEGTVFEDESIKVIAFPVLHGAWPQAFGYRIETADKVIIYSGDLRPNDKILEYSKGADYLIHEVYCHSGLDKRSDEDKRYHSNNHTSSIQLGELAAEVKPKNLILNHILWFGCTAEKIVEEVKLSFNGNIIVAEDLDVYE